MLKNAGAGMDMSTTAEKKLATAKRFISSNVPAKSQTSNSKPILTSSLMAGKSAVTSLTFLSRSMTDGNRSSRARVLRQESGFFARNYLRHFIPTLNISYGGKQ